VPKNSQSVKNPGLSNKLSAVHQIVLKIAKPKAHEKLRGLFWSTTGCFKM
jgi:hypothetical protein